MAEETGSGWGVSRDKVFAAAQKADIAVELDPELGELGRRRDGVRGEDDVSPSGQYHRACEHTHTHTHTTN